VPVPPTPPSKLPAAVEAVVAEQGGGTEPSKLPVPPTTPLLPILRPHQTHAVKEAVEERGRRGRGPYRVHAARTLAARCF
jgi:hypothetical protein